MISCYAERTQHKVVQGRCPVCNCRSLYRANFLLEQLAKTDTGLLACSKALDKSSPQRVVYALNLHFVLFEAVLLRKDLYAGVDVGQQSGSVSALTVGVIVCSQ